MVGTRAHIERRCARGRCMAEEQAPHSAEVAPSGNVPPTIPSVPQEILEKLPAETRHQIEAFFAADPQADGERHVRHSK